MAVIVVDPVAEAATGAGNPTVAPSPGEVIVTTVAVEAGVGSGAGVGAGGGAGAGAGAGVPEALPPEVLPPGVLVPALAPEVSPPALPEVEPAEGGGAVLPLPALVPDPGLVAPVAGELVEGRAELVDVNNELDGPAEPPHPTIAAIRTEENKIRLCRIPASASCDRHTNASSSKGNYLCINSGDMGKIT